MWRLWHWCRHQVHFWNNCSHRWSLWQTKFGEEALRDNTERSVMRRVNNYFMDKKWMHIKLNRIYYMFYKYLTQISISYEEIYLQHLSEICIIFCSKWGFLERKMQQQKLYFLYSEGEDAFLCYVYMYLFLLGNYYDPIQFK